VPSFYALDVRRTTLGKLPNVDEFEREAARNGGAELAWLAPRNQDNAIDEVEHDLAVLRPLLLADPRSGRGQGRYLLELSPELGRSLRTRWQRWQRRWRAADGICNADEPTRAALSRYRPTTRAYSPTSLQNFAACPYKFALASIYRLEAREEPVPLQMLDPLTRGSMYHAVVARFLRQAVGDNALPVMPKNLKQAQERCDAILNEVAAEYHELLAPAIERVWQDEVEALRADLRGWLIHLADHPDGFVPLLIEFGFGLPPDRGRDPGSATGPARLEGGFLLHGVVDLVEQNPQNGKLRVTDHKTGKNRTEDGMIVGAGEVLQPVLYSLAVEAMRHHTIDEARLSFCTAVGAYEDHAVTMNDAAREVGLEVLRIIDNALEGAFLPPVPKEKGCDWCDFRAICGPYEELRASHKDPAPLAALLKLRAMP
jgi:RecB family exonuclease